MHLKFNSEDCAELTLSLNASLCLVLTLLDLLVQLLAVLLHLDHDLVLVVLDLISDQLWLTNVFDFDTD